VALSGPPPPIPPLRPPPPPFPPAVPPGSPSFTGSRDVLRQTVARHGWLGMYRGLSPNLAFAFPKCAVRFAAFEYVAAAMRGGAGAGAGAGSVAGAGPPAPLTASQSFTAGLVSGVIEAVTVIIPMTTIQVKFIADLNRPAPSYRGLAHGVAAIAGEEGLGGLYRGAGPTLLKIALNMSFRFLIYNELTATLDAAWARQWPRAAGAGAGAGGDPPWWAPPEAVRPTVVSLAAGAIAGAVTVVGNHPVDVVKSYMQAQGKGRGGPVYASAVACGRGIAAAQGIRGLYAGLVPRLNRVVLETSLSFTFYAHLSALANQYIDGRP
jgi:solute carrier family 25 (mitochondrial citrate transporter), member 1